VGNERHPTCDAVPLPWLIIPVVMSESDLPLMRSVE
jgi:hypothetical protein